MTACKWSHLNAQGHTPLGVFWGPLWGALFSACREGKIVHVCGLLMKWKFIFKNRFRGLLSSNLIALGAYTTLSITFWVQCMVPFPLHAGKGKCYMWLGNKVEIYFYKVGFVDSKLPNLIALGAYTTWCHSLFGSNVGCPFLRMLHIACRSGNLCF